MYNNTVAMLVASVIVIPTLLWFYRVVEKCGQTGDVVKSSRRSGLVQKTDVGVQARPVRRWSCPARLGRFLMRSPLEVEYAIVDEPSTGSCEQTEDATGQWWTFV